MSTDSSQPPFKIQPTATSLVNNQQPLYEYHMIQIPSNFFMKANQVQGNEIALYVQDCANRNSDSWEFYRIDTMTMTANPGCLSALFGGKPAYTEYSVMTFRRLKGQP